MHRVLRSALAGIVAVSLGALAHRAAGGDVAPAATLAVLAALVALAALLTHSHVRALAALVVGSVAVQPVLHVVLERVDGTAAGHGGMAAADHSTAAGDSAAMLVLHLLLAVAAALVVRYGGRWLALVPHCAAQLAVLARSASSSLPPAGLAATGSVDWALPRPPRTLWDSRGPPQ